MDASDIASNNLYKSMFSSNKVVWIDNKEFQNNKKIYLGIID